MSNESPKILEIMTGKPVVTGTRIPVEQVLARLAEKSDIKDLFDTFPGLTTEDVRACLAFASQRIASEHEAKSGSRDTTIAHQWNETVQTVESRNPDQGTGQEPDEESEIELDEDRFHFVSLEEGRELLEKQAQKYLNMSGEEFRRQYRAGLLDYEQSEVIRVSFLLPFAEFPADDQTEQP